MRYLSITFDDGLINGVWKSVELLERAGTTATFYVVAGWVQPRLTPWIRDPWNKGYSHGDWQAWRQVAHRGHDIGSHTMSHFNAAGRLLRWLPFLTPYEIRGSYLVMSHYLPLRPMSISMPWNSTTPRSESWVKRTYEACCLGQQEPHYNSLEGLNWYRLQAWAPDSRVSTTTICNHIEMTPDNHWLILQFHSLDGEGYMPISSAKLEAILQCMARAQGLLQLTIRGMVDRFKHCLLPTATGSTNLF